MSDGGKGDTPRPFSVPKEKFDSNWDAIFKKQPEPEVKDEPRTKNNDRNN
jgi:hypothetical protein